MNATTKTTIQITNALEMAGFIKANGTQCRFVSMISKTPVVKMRVGNPWHVIKKGKVVGTCRLFKLSTKIGLINVNYNNAVCNRIAAHLNVKPSQVEYENGECWYEHLMTVGAEPKALPLVQHKDEAERKGLLLQYFPHKSTNCYVDENGVVVPDETVKPWLYAESDRAEFKPAVTAIYLNNIVKLTASGVVMVAEDYEEAEKALAEAAQ